MRRYIVLLITYLSFHTFTTAAQAQELVVASLDTTTSAEATSLNTSSLFLAHSEAAATDNHKPIIEWILVRGGSDPDEVKRLTELRLAYGVLDTTISEAVAETASEDAYAYRPRAVAGKHFNPDPDPDWKNFWNPGMRGNIEGKETAVQWSLELDEIERADLDTKEYDGNPFKWNAGLFLTFGKKYREAVTRLY
ncbi:hypothetical protein GW943_00640 [Candidatus Parcubacteria bacterium]|uniref:Uncharacterized protein n=1 Tax=Candidatus Kaiserbacteria bacterium CG10_big_fil_rev_8_21_14_0_10_47_16 TaxID=1974608 RepID=A0A2H0UD47_9BACT|nr:hypothetical protein [Candidatus Parcubacteria bacterium]PIR84348.1 MAG: hypothetical protein COU16_02015 [Candidatus Kaiserbacteria bacterium CG10_big_fil_rev_8_21_14_0_10_47_16]